MPGKPMIVKTYRRIYVDPTTPVASNLGTNAWRKTHQVRGLTETSAHYTAFAASRLRSRTLIKYVFSVAAPKLA